MPKNTYLPGDTLEHTDKVLYVESGPSSHPERSHLKSDENRLRLVESLQYDY